MTDPYKVLEVSRDASMDDIKKQYRALSRKYHPDSNINNPDKDKAEEKFKEVQAAYEQIVYKKNTEPILLIIMREIPAPDTETMVTATIPTAMAVSEIFTIFSGIWAVRNTGIHNTETRNAETRIQAKNNITDPHADIWLRTVTERR